MKLKALLQFATVVLVCLVPVACKKNRPPNAPSVSGPLSGKYGDTLTFSMSAVDPDGGDVAIYVEWGDGLTTDWTTPAGSGVAIQVAHVYAESGAFSYRVKARDAALVESEWSETRTIQIGNAAPFKPEAPAGPTTLEEWAQGAYRAVALSPTGESLFVRFDWGDSTGDWLGPFASGETCSAVHIYDTVGAYGIRAQARHASGAESQWSTALKGRPRRSLSRPPGSES